MSNMSTMTSTTPPTSPPLSPRTIVAPMTPTGVPSFRIHNDTHNTNTDPDPTEWKPVILPTRTSSSSSSLASSDAWNYLSQFHGGDETMLPRRPTHRSTTSLPALGSTVPSLTRAPSVASSLSSTASDYLGSIYELSSSSLQQRPLPPRHNPYSSSSAAATKGVELVVPHIVSAPDDADADVRVSDSGSIFPASSSVWEDGPCENSGTAPIDVARLGVRSVQARAQEI